MKKAAVLILCVVLVCCVLVGCGNLPEEIYGSESNNEEFAPGQFYFTIENEQGDHESHQFVLRELVSGYDKDNTNMYNNGGTIRCDFIVVLDTGAERQYRICKRQVAQSDPLFEYTAPLTVWS